MTPAGKIKVFNEIIGTKQPTQFIETSKKKVLFVKFLEIIFPFFSLLKKIGVAFTRNIKRYLLIVIIRDSLLVIVLNK